MMLIKDAMVLIHLAKISLLETSCDYFGRVFISPLVKNEVTEKKHPDSFIIGELIEKNKIKIKNVKNTSLIKRAKEFNIQGAEAEAIALYWELQADLIATDDDNVRRKRDILKISIIGTPAILLKLYKENRISKDKLAAAIQNLKKIGWFSNTVWDKIMMEAEK